jgi:hypothetical protein
MTNIREMIKRRFSPANPIEPGIYKYQSPPHAEFQYRLHLRIEEGGHGLLIIDASTILHLNQTAAEYAFYLVEGTPLDEIIRRITNRYDIDYERTKADYLDFREKIFSLIDMPDLDPVSFLDFERELPYSKDISAPYRLDCALTYNLPEGFGSEFAPTKNVDRELSTDEWITIISKAWEAGIPHIVFTGGEPTLRDDLPTLISHAEAIGQVTGLLTDGLKLADSKYLNQLLLTGLDHLMIVLQPSSDLAWDALKLTLPEDLFTTVHITLTPDISHTINGLLTKLADMGTNAISLSAKEMDLEGDLRSARDFAAELGLNLVWDLPVPYSSRNPVALDTIDDEFPEGSGKAWLYVEPDGDVLPAQGINQVLGNFLRDDWKSIWNKE